MKANARGPLLIAATAVLWSFGGLLIKLIPWDAMTIVGIRAVFAAAIMAIYMRRPRITFSLPVILGGVSMSATTILFVFANKLTTSANAIVLQYTGPIFVILLSAMVFRKRPSALDIAAVLVTFAGIALFFFEQPQSDTSLLKHMTLGNILACLSGLAFAGVFLVNTRPNVKPEEPLLLGHLINVAIALPFIATRVTLEPVAWLAISLLGIFQLGLAYVLFSIGIKSTPPVTASLIAVLEPLLNPVWVFLLGGSRELPGPLALAGGALVLVTVASYNVVSMRRVRLAAARRDTAA
jgi:drug/metabolite transporter (DMT)-like permease